MGEYISCWQHFKKNYLGVSLLALIFGTIPMIRGGIEYWWINIITVSIVIIAIIANYYSWRKTKRSLGEGPKE